VDRLAGIMAGCGAPMVLGERLSAAFLQAGITSAGEQAIGAAAPRLLLTKRCQ
jgi:hypothetical protein